MELQTDIVMISPYEIMETYKLSRDETYNLLNTKGCPVLPRKAHAPYRVIKDEFETWMRRQVVK